MSQSKRRRPAQRPTRALPPAQRRPPAQAERVVDELDDDLEENVEPDDLEDDHSPVAADGAVVNLDDDDEDIPPLVVEIAGRRYDLPGEPPFVLVRFMKQVHQLHEQGRAHEMSNARAERVLRVLFGREALAELEETGVSPYKLGRSLAKIAEAYNARGKAQARQTRSQPGVRARR